MRGVTRSLIAVVAVVALVGVGAGCGGDDEPAVCGSLRDLQGSIQSLRDIELSNTSTEELQAASNDISADVEAVRSDADEELGQEVDTFEATVRALADDIEAAAAAGNVTRDTLAELATDVTSAAAAFETLKNAAPHCDLDES